MRTSCELHSLFILNPDDYERGRMSLMERSHLAHYVWYIKPPDTLAGVFLFVENNVWSLRRVATKLETGIVLSE